MARQLKCSITTISLRGVSPNSNRIKEIVKRTLTGPKSKPMEV